MSSKFKAEKIVKNLTKFKRGRFSGGCFSYCCPKKRFSKHHKLKLLISGAVIGMLNGFFGGGGGMVCVPILENVLKLDNKSAHASAIAVIFPLSVISAFIYIYNGYIESLPLLVIGSGVVAGGLVGSYALKILPPKAVRAIFAVIMFAGGVKLIF